MTAGFSVETVAIGRRWEREKTMNRLDYAVKISLK